MRAAASSISKVIAMLCTSIPNEASITSPSPSIYHACVLCANHDTVSQRAVRTLSTRREWFAQELACDLT